MNRIRTSVPSKATSRRAVAAFLAIVSGAACARVPADDATLPPDAAKRLVAEHAAVTSASPLASDAGVAMLRAGGNAVDAAVATAFAIGVVEPQMSGLGGGGGMLIWLQDERRVEYLDFYAAQPAAAFARAAAANGGDGALRIVAVPGAVAGLIAAHERFGRLPLADVLAPAIRLAEDGFPINQVLAQMIADDSVKLHRDPGAARFAWPGGRPLAPGRVVTNAPLASALRAIATGGRDAFYRGDGGRAMVAAMNAGGHPVTPDEFAAYEPQWKRPLCTAYRGQVVLSAPPPQTGSQVLHTLEMLEAHDLPALGLPTRSAAAFDVLASALRVGMADNRGNDDPRWAAVPAAGVASEAFARERAPLVGARSVPERVEPGDARAFDGEEPAAACVAFQPWTAAAANGGQRPAPTVPDAAAEGGETTHLSVVDADGNAVALTQTNSSLFGSGAFAAGFFLNDSGYRFGEVGSPAAQWRTRTSTIAPTIVLEGGRVRLVSGAPGGGRIPTAIVQTLVYTLDYEMDPLAALRMPRMFPSPSNPRVELENGFAADVLRDARAMGWEPGALSFGYARLYSIVRRGDRWIAVADPRHDGEPRGW